MGRRRSRNRLNEDSSMNLVFIYGPPAAGKLTVATELSNLIDYKLLDNHAVINTVTRIFPFSDTEHAALRRKLSRKFRIELFEAAAENDISLVTTLGASGQEYFDFFADTQEAVEKHGGTVCFVQLLPTEEALYDRITGQSRKELHKLGTPEELKSRIMQQPDMFMKYPNVEHLTIDNTEMSPGDVAEIIRDHYKLS